MYNKVLFLNFIRKNITSVKYLWFLVFFFSVILAIRTYINYLTIQETITNTSKEITLQKQQIAYTKNFLLRYYTSEYQEYFFHHKNSILEHWEKIIQIKIIDPNEKVEEIASQNNDNWEKVLSPAESRNQFIREKWEKI